METQTKEMTVLREEFVKHFELPDGTGAAVVYDSPVHYEKDGTWVEIDNTLVSATKMGGDVNAVIVRNDRMTAVTDAAQADTKGVVTTAYYENNDNPFKVQLPAAMDKNTPIAVTHGEHTLRFCFDGAAGTASGTLEQPFTTQEKNAQLQEALSTAADEQEKLTADKEHAMTVWKNRSAVTFASVQPNVDLQYHVSGKKLKETLVFQQVPTARSFSFTFTYTGLQAVLQEDNSVHFMDNAGAVAFIVASPYMFDNDEGYSTDITVTLQETAMGCRYTLTPDRAWLTDAKRVYPVTLDPTVASEQVSSIHMQDAGVQQSNPNTHYEGVDRIYVGSGPNSTKGIMFFKLLQWPENARITRERITKAELRLAYYPTASWQTGHDFTIQVWKLNTPWSHDDFTWNDSLDVFGQHLPTADYDIVDARQKTSGYDIYDVTYWAKAHYEQPATEHGIRLQPETVSSSVNRVCYASVEHTNANKKPLVTIYYNYEYTLSLQQYYDVGFIVRYGSPAMITTYTGYVHDYFLEKYNIKIYSTISAYVSLADQCSHKNSVNDLCQKELPLENAGTNVNVVCDYQTGSYHCCNIDGMLSTLPAGASVVSNDTKIVMWTGHVLCEGCTLLNPTSTEALGCTFSPGRQILICHGDDVAYAQLTGVPSYKEFTCTLAHELGHTLGCQGDASDTCVEPSECIMAGSDSDELFDSLDELMDAYCDTCDRKIQYYAEMYL